MAKEMTQNLFKVGDWVHTMDGIGVVTLVFPVYYQYWQKQYDDRYRLATYGDNSDLADSLLGKSLDVGDWVKDILTVKRLADHDAEPMKRIMCLSGLAYANDTITKKELATMKRILKNDPTLAARFDKHQCKYRQDSRGWAVEITKDQVSNIRAAFKVLDGNSTGQLAMTARDIEQYLETEFGINLYKLMLRNKRGNATIAARLLPENDAQYYNADREELFCQLQLQV